MPLLDRSPYRETILARYTTKYMQFDLIRLSSHKAYCSDIPSPVLTKVTYKSTRNDDYNYRQRRLGTR
jgi:hypothetical protein